MRLKNIIAAALFSISVTGCSSIYNLLVFQIDVAQGNYVEQEQVDKLRVDMSKEQVSFVMGTPMMVDTFAQNKWYYLYHFHPGGGDVDSKKMELTFVDNRLTTIEGDFELNPNFATPIQN